MKYSAIGFGSIAVIALSAGSAFAEGRDMRIVNQTGFEIVEFYSLHKGETEWGADKLDGTPIGGDDERLLDLDDGSGYCLYSFRVVFDDGEELLSDNINICDLAMFTYY